jgi:hypothetical protein
MMKLEGLRNRHRIAKAYLEDLSGVDGLDWRVRISIEIALSDFIEVVEWAEEMCELVERLTDQKSASSNPADTYKPKGLRFFDKVSGSQFIFADDSEPRPALRGWLFYQHPDGRWVSVRKATEADLDAIYKCACGHPRSQYPRDRGCETRSCECKYFCVPQQGEASAMKCSACSVPFQDHLGVQKTCEKLQQAEAILRKLYEEFCPIYSGTSRICKRCHTGGGLPRPWRHAASCEMKRVEEYLSGLV